jgi:hypothetical protein
MISFRFSLLLCCCVWVLAGCGDNTQGSNTALDGGQNDNNNVFVDGGPEPDAFECPPQRVVCEGVCCQEGEKCREEMCCPEISVCAQYCCGQNEVCMGGYCHLRCSNGVRCLDVQGNEMCCLPGQLCFMNTCINPGASCSTDADCALDEYCEETVGSCLPIPDSNCEYYPPVGEFTPTVEWTWPDPNNPPAVLPHHVDVLTPPAVGDMDGDGIPEVAFIAYRDSCDGGSYWTGVLTILRGDTGEEVLRNDDPSRRLGSSTAPALGDIDMDGQAEVVVMRDNYNLLAYEIDGTLMWESDPPQTSIRYGAISISDLDTDGDPEIFIGPTVYDHQGVFVCRGTAGVGGWPNRAISTAADLDLDGDLEIVAGNTAYHHDCSVMWQNSNVGDGWPGVADVFDASGMAGTDGLPEITLIADGQLYVLNGQDGSTVWGPHAIPGNTGSNFGGAPNVADFDGDGYAEIGTAGGAYMVVFDPDGADPVLWQQPTKDTSSAITGSTVFDFEADGEAEIVYTDECFVRIYRGTDGEILFQESNNTRTHNEYPIIVDIDADGSSELVVTSNICVWNCESEPGWQGPARRGIKVYGDADLNWVRTRTIWNQHAYYVTNVNEDGTIPSPEPKNWLTPGLNNFRQNVQTWGVHNAPNMTGDMFGGDPRNCTPGGEIVLGLMVLNAGSKGVSAAVPIGFYRVLEDDSEVFLGQAATTQPLLPGMSEYVEYTWSIPANLDPFPTAFSFKAVVDDPAIEDIAIHECNDDDNAIGPIEVICDVVD